MTLCRQHRALTRSRSAVQEGERRHDRQKYNPPREERQRARMRAGILSHPHGGHQGPAETIRTGICPAHRPQAVARLVNGDCSYGGLVEAWRWSYANHCQIKDVR